MRARAYDFVYFKRALGFQPCARVCRVCLLEGFPNFSFCVVALLRAYRFLFCLVCVFYSVCLSVVLLLVLFLFLSACPYFCGLFVCLLV